jgi:LPXTG-motif cell wall-anchored protein
MFKKIASILMAASMLLGVAAVTASAAESEESVAAEGSSEVAADASSEVSAAKEIYFDVNSSGWGNVRTVYCHIWAADGVTKPSSGEDWPSWQGKAEKCKFDKDTGIATYDLSKTGHEFKESDGNKYCVIFSANTGMQTYNTIMSGSCIGDTVYCTGNQIENPEDSEKKAIEAAWRKNPNCGPEKKITSTGNIVGTAYPEGCNDTTLLAQYLIQYYNDPAKLELTQQLLDTLKVSPKDVISVCASRLGDDPDKKLPEIEKVLLACTDPTTGNKVDKEQLEEGKKNPTQSGTTSNGGSTSTNGGSSNGSNSVSSGQETTIFFVFAGLMISAAGVMFLARKKNA